MYKCLDCETEFEEVAKVREPHGEHLSHCPSCGSDDFVELAGCKICGEILMTDYDTDYMNFCHCCIGVIENDLKAILDLFKAHHTKESVIEFIGQWAENQQGGE